MSLVADASLTLAWYFEDERTPAVDALLDRVVQDGAVVPSLWRLDAAYRDRALQQLGLLPIAVDAETGDRAWTTTLQLADRFGLTIYDATYLELARRRALPLATLDRALRNAGRALSIPLLGSDG